MAACSAALAFASASPRSVLPTAARALPMRGDAPRVSMAPAPVQDAAAAFASGGDHLSLTAKLGCAVSVIGTVAMYGRGMMKVRQRAAIRKKARGGQRGRRALQKPIRYLDMERVPPDDKKGTRHGPLRVCVSKIYKVIRDCNPSDEMEFMPEPPKGLFGRLREWLRGPWRQ
ncbi:unnamed protein product [Prorocentrum cordatum]|uniref:PS II complex 12 kDa extrinsic protein n=1 Tax=Prorocentrum cordatum TaxID=2364126 RepID=A0ABN9QRH4_9DINO|nr:unnamed protein product [Polarella glacialis]